jgi:hypothetical protein
VAVGSNWQSRKVTLSLCKQSHVCADSAWSLVYADFTADALCLYPISRKKSLHVAPSGRQQILCTGQIFYESVSVQKKNGDKKWVVSRTVLTAGDWPMLHIQKHRHALDDKQTMLTAKIAGHDILTFFCGND